MFIGSCFASSIAAKMAMGRMPVMVNPAGTVYNPASVCNTLDTLISEKEFVADDLFFHGGTYLSFYHYTDFSSPNGDDLIEKINRTSREALSFLSKASFLFITFGTARVYRLKKSGIIVSNCHKLPASYFEPHLLSVSEIVFLWSRQLERLHSLFPSMKFVFTVSPVRHMKDGVHGNQVSKSILFLAIEELLKHPVSPIYFPAYELLMDDLRDYRFYADDMLHPSASAIDYIWEAFSSSFMVDKTMNLWNECVKISKARQHRFNSESSANSLKFAEKMIRHINELEEKLPEIDLSADRIYFQSLPGK
jgi:hypothetical protein